MSLRSLLYKELRWLRHNVATVVLVLVVLPSIVAAGTVAFQQVIPRDTPVALVPANENVTEDDMTAMRGVTTFFAEPHSYEVDEREQAMRALTREEVYAVVEARNVGADAADEIARAAANRYQETRVEPLDPVGTVSAQSIGEPGTQMSVPADERVVVRQRGETDVTEIGPLVDRIFETADSRRIEDHEVALAPKTLEVPSLRSDERVEWKSVQEVSRHDAPDELLEFTLESGRSIRATKAHSFVTRQDNDVVPVAGDDLSEGDWLPVVRELPVSASSDTLDLREHLTSESYWFTSALTDGGAAAFPASDEQVANKRAALDRGDIDVDTAYPVGGTVGLPEQFPLDDETGFFVGAWLAEGSLADGYVSISNVDPAFQERIRSFADRFDLSRNEYEKIGRAHV